MCVCVCVCNTFCPFAKVTLPAEILYPFFSYPPQLYFLFIYFFGNTVRHTELPQPGIKPAPPSVEAWNLNPWTTREAHPPSSIEIC